MLCKIFVKFPLISAESRRLQLVILRKAKELGYSLLHALAFLWRYSCSFPPFSTRWWWVINVMSGLFIARKQPSVPTGQLDGWMRPTIRLDTAVKRRISAPTGSQNPILLVSNPYTSYCSYCQCTEIWRQLPCAEVKELSSDLPQQPADVVRIYDRAYFTASLFHCCL